MKNSHIQKGALGGMLALALLASVVPVAPVKAATTGEIQTQIQALLAQLNALNGAANNQNTRSCSTFTNDLSLGRSGAEVTNLQKFLISRGHALPSGPTGYFGEQTRAALAQFQSQNGISPASGNFGPLTRGKVNALCAVTTAPNPVPNQTPGTGTGSGATNQPSTTLRGEGELDQVDIEAAADTSIREAATDAPIAEVTVEARDGDITITRLDVSLVANSGNRERDPWDTFENLSVWVDGEKLAEQKINNRSLFLNRNTGTVRLSNLNLTLEEDEAVDITIAASLKNNISGAGETANWSVSVGSIRYKDADGVVTTDTTTGDLKDTVDFEIVERGDGEELKFSSSNSSPAERTIIVDDKKRTNNVSLLRYNIEALGGDLELDKLYVKVETGTAAYSDVVSDIRLKVGNKTFKKDAVTMTGDYGTSSVLVAFDINNKITINEDEQVAVEVLVDLKAKTTYQNGETIKASVTSAERDRTEAEGADDVTAFSGSVVGKSQTLIAEGIYVPVSSAKFKTESIGSNNSTGVFTINFEVNAVEGDFYIANTATTSSVGTTTIGGVQYSVDTTVGTPDAVSAVLSSTADEDVNGVFLVREGRSETFTLTVTVDAALAGHHRVLLNALAFSDNTDGVTGATTYTVTPVNEFRTPYQFINN